MALRPLRASDPYQTMVSRQTPSSDTNSRLPPRVRSSSSGAAGESFRPALGKALRISRIESMCGDNVEKNRLRRRGGMDQ